MQTSALIVGVALLCASTAAAQVNVVPPLPQVEQPRLSFEEANALAQEPRWLSLAYAEFDTRGPAPAVPADLRTPALREGEYGYFVVQLTGPITQAAKSAVTATGAHVLDYVPNDAFLVRATAAQLDLVRARPEVVWSGVYEPAYRLDARLRVASADAELAAIARRIVAVAFQGVERALVEAQVLASGAKVLEAHGDTGRWLFVLSATPVEARSLAQARDVQWIEPEGELTPRNNTMVWTVQTFTNGSTRLWTNNLDGSGQVIGHIDGSIATTSCYFADPAGNPIGPLHRKLVYNSGTGADSHGTHTAGTAAADAQPVNGSTSNRGLAHMARLAHTTGFPFATFASVVSTHAGVGARMHTNSWGDDSTTAYNTLSNQIDSFSHDNEDNLVFFAVTNTSSLKNPENAKNLLAVGASQNGASANSFCSGGAGPTADGRRKPEVYTPGCSIVSAGTASCTTASLTGTSMASPSSTAAGALVREYFMDGFYPTGAAVPGDAFTPTGALVKAVLVNTTQDMTAVAGYPSNTEGWGRINLDESLYFAGDTSKMFVVDVRMANGLSTGQSSVQTFTVNASTTPLEITLAFHDFPGTAGASNPVVNNLDLIVTAPGGSPVYRGNVFSGGWSASGGVADAKNNVERVAVQSPAVGAWTITIDAVNVPQPAQGFGLCVTGDIYGGTGGSSSPTNYCTASLTSSFCQPSMSASGLASASAASGFVLAANDVEGNKQGILFYGVNGRNAAPWAPGSGSFLCVKTPVQRMGALTSGGTSGLCDGVLAQDWNAYVATHPTALGQPFSAGQIVNAQGWFRDPPAPSTTNLTDGIEFTVVP